MRKPYAKLALAGGAILSGLGWMAISQAAMAAPQSAGPAGTASQPAASALDELVEIIVTARKRTERLRDIPVSVEAVSGVELAEAKITQIIDLQAQVPTLSISTGLTQPFVGIRGFGSGNSQSFDQAVGKFIDNVSYGRDQDARLPLFDLERVEVLKGPQVLLYGNSTTAGALNLATKKPGDRFEADGSAAYEFNNNEWVLQGGLTAPLSETVSVRVAGMFQDLARGPNFNVATNQRVSTDRNHAQRVTVGLQPSDDLEIMLKVEFDHIRNYGGVGEPAAQPTSGPFQFNEVNLDGRVNSNNNVAPLFQKDYIGLDNETYQMDLNYDIWGGTFSSTTAYRYMEMSLSAGGGSHVPLFNGTIYYDNGQFSQELRYNATVNSIDFVLGGFYQHEARDAITTADFNFPAGGIPLPALALDMMSDQKVDSYSGFGDITYHVTDELSLELGARYSVIIKDGTQAAIPGNVVPGKSFGDGPDIVSPNPALDPLYTIIFGVPPHTFDNLHLRNEFFQPQAILQYSFAEKNQAYLKYVKGDKAGGFDVAYQGFPGNVTPRSATFEPEKAESFEAGIKGLVLDNRLDYALAGFRTTFTNLQTNAYVGQATVAVVANVGKARTQGLEAELHYNPLPGLRINATGAYTDAKYIDFPGGSCTRAQATATPVGCVQDLSGTPTPYSSKWTGSLGIEYEQYIDEYSLTGAVLMTARSKYNVTTNNEPQLEQSGYTQIDAHIDLRPKDGWWSVALFGRNLGDKRLLEYGSVAPGTQNGLLGFLSRGRQLGIRTGFKF